MQAKHKRLPSELMHSFQNTLLIISNTDGYLVSAIIVAGDFPKTLLSGCRGNCLRNEDDYRKLDTKSLYQKIFEMANTSAQLELLGALIQSVQLIERQAGIKVQILNCF